MNKTDTIFLYCKLDRLMIESGTREVIFMVFVYFYVRGRKMLDKYGKMCIMFSKRANEQTSKRANEQTCRGELCSPESSNLLCFKIKGCCKIPTVGFLRLSFFNYIKSQEEFLCQHSQ